MKQIVLTALLALGLTGACSIAPVPASSSSGASSGEMISNVVQEEGGGACVCDTINCSYSECRCDDACSSGDACVACCKGICDACGAACVKASD